MPDFAPEFPIKELLSDVGTGKKGQNTINFVNTPDGRWKPIAGTSEGYLIVSDESLLQRIQSLEALVRVLVNNQYIEYRILSTDPFPEAKPTEKGAQLIVMDTGQVYFNYGNRWGEF